MWQRFRINPRREAIAMQLLPGDGIARRVMVRKGYLHEECEQRLELLFFDNHEFIGRDPSGIQYACQ
jgi:hypothetical protein